MYRSNETLRKYPWTAIFYGRALLRDGQKLIARWCNGNTPAFGAVVPGSNPGWAVLPSVGGQQNDRNSVI